MKKNVSLNLKVSKVSGVAFSPTLAQVSRLFFSLFVFPSYADHLRATSLGSMCVKLLSEV